MPGYPTSCLSNAYMLLVPALREIARLKPRTRPPSHCRSASGSSRPRSTSVLYGAHRRRPGDAGVQGVGRHHLDVAGRWLHRNPRADRHRRKGRNSGGEAVLGHCSSAREAAPTYCDSVNRPDAEDEHPNRPCHKPNQQECEWEADDRDDDRPQGPPERANLPRK